MNTKTDDPRTIRVETFLPHPPSKVWRALTDPERLGRWLAPNDFKLEVGHRFTFRMDPIPAADFDGTTRCEVLEFEPRRLLRISWRGGTLDTTVTWTLRAEAGGTRLYTVHDGFDPDDPINRMARQGMGSGWASVVIQRLHDLLDEPAIKPC